MSEVIVVTQEGEEIPLSDTFVRRSPVLMDMVEDCTSLTGDTRIPMPTYRRESLSLVEWATARSAELPDSEGVSLGMEDVSLDDTVLMEALKLTDFLGMEEERKHLVQAAGKRLAKISSDALKGRIPMSAALETISVFFPPPTRK